MGFKVLIIGGGMGGLCLAQGLKKAGIEVELFERDRTPTERAQGYRIRLGEDGLSSLKECLPADHYKKLISSCSQSRGKVNPGISLLTMQLSELVRFQVGSWEEAEENNRPASRTVLRNILLEGMDSVVHFDKRFTHYTVSEDGKTVTAHFEDGTTAEGNLLVGADGGNSRVRHQLLPHAQRIETGVVAIAGKVPLTPEVRALLPDFLFSGPGLASSGDGWAMFMATFVTSPELSSNDHKEPSSDASHLDDMENYLMWSISATKTKFSPNVESMSPKELLAEARMRVQGWHPLLQKFVELGQESTVTQINIRTSVKVDPWDSGIVTLVGDAIHSMTPFRGIGGNQALKDAANLCAVIAGIVKNGQLVGDLVPAIHGYESEMIARGFKWVDLSLQTMRLAHLEGKWEVMLRNWALRAANLIMNPKRVLLGPSILEPASKVE